MTALCITSPSLAHDDVLYSQAAEHGVFYEGLLIVDAEKIYSSYYGRDVYRVELYDEALAELSYLTITPDCHSYGFIFHVYAKYFQIRYDAGPSWVNNGNTIILPHMRTATTYRQNFIPLIHRVHKRAPKKSFKTFRNTKSASPRFFKKRKYKTKTKRRKHRR